MAPCVLYLRRTGKGAVSGVNGQGDSGVSSPVVRHAAHLAQRPRDRDVFFVGTCNDISRLPPEFARAERFDGLFMIDLPGRSEKPTIWRMYLPSSASTPNRSAGR